MLCLVVNCAYNSRLHHQLIVAVNILKEAELGHDLEVVSLLHIGVRKVVIINHNAHVVKFW